MAIKCCTKEFMLDVISPCPVVTTQTGTFSGAKVFTFPMPINGYFGFSVFCDSVVTFSIGAALGTIENLPDGRTVTSMWPSFAIPTLGNLSITVNGGVGDYEVHFWTCYPEQVTVGVTPYTFNPLYQAGVFTHAWKNGDIFWMGAGVSGVSPISPLEFCIYDSAGVLFQRVTSATIVTLTKDDTFTVQVRGTTGTPVFFCHDCAIKPLFATDPTTHDSSPALVEWTNQSQEGQTTPIAERWYIVNGASAVMFDEVNVYGTGIIEEFFSNCNGCAYGVTLWNCDNIGRIYGLTKGGALPNFTHAAIDLGATSYTNDPAFVTWWTTWFGGIGPMSGVLAGVSGCTRTDTGMVGFGCTCYAAGAAALCDNTGQTWIMILSCFGSTWAEYHRDVDQQNPLGVYTLFYVDPFLGVPDPPATITIT